MVPWPSFAWQPLATLLGVDVWRRVGALPHVGLEQGFDPGNMPAVDPSVIGNLRNGGAAGSAPAKGTGVQVDRLHAQITTISLGTPPQTLSCLLDSGSSDLWVPSRRCARCHNERHFYADASSTFQPELIRTRSGKRPKAVRISYGSGTVVGYSARDRLKLGSLDIPQQAFIIVEDAALPPGRNWDGICGLGWKGIAHVGPTLYESVWAQGRPPLFTISPPASASASPAYLWPQQSMRQGHMLIGEVPTETVDGSMVWVDAEPFDPTGGRLSSQRTFWVVSGGVKIHRPQPVPVRFIVDTGTNQVLLVPQRHYNSFIQALIPAYIFEESCGMDRSAGVVCDCSLRQDTRLLPLQIYLGGVPFVLPLSEMFMEVHAMNGGTLCLLTIQPNAMAPSRVQGIGGLLGDLLGALFGGGRAPMASSSATGRDLPQQQAPPMQAQQGQQDQLPPMPFRLPGMSHQEAQGPPEEVVEEVTEYVRPNGEVCKVTRLVRGGQVIQTSQPECEMPQRRLQSFGWPFGSSSGGQGMPMPMQRQQSQPDDELWMIGGVFLEHFVTAFDFRNGRMGLGKPAQAQEAARRLKVKAENQHEKVPLFYS